MNLSTTINTYLTEISQKLEGWFFPIDMILFGLLEQYQRQANVIGDIAEVGVWKGKSLVYLAQLTERRNNIYAFDWFMDDCLEQTQANVKQYAGDAPIQYIKGDTSDYTFSQMTEIIKNPLRMLHIDAGHEYHEVLHTMHLLAPFVHDQGVIMMDDYQDREFPGVHSAVLDFCYSTTHNSRFVPFLIGANKTYLANPLVAKNIQRFLASHPNFMDKCRLSRIKDDVVLITYSKLPMKSSDILSRLSDAQLDSFDEVFLASITQKAKSLQQVKWMGKR